MLLVFYKIVFDSTAAARGSLGDVNSSGESGRPRGQLLVVKYSCSLKILLLAFYVLNESISCIFSPNPNISNTLNKHGQVTLSKAFKDTHAASECS